MGIGSWRGYRENKGNQERAVRAGLILIVGIPEGAAGALMALDFRPYLGSGRFSIRLTQRDPSKGTATTGNTRTLGLQGEDYRIRGMCHDIRRPT